MTTTKEADATLEIVKGYVDQSEITYESHKRGKNWTATVVYDPGAPGELERLFWNSNGKNVEVPEDLRPGSMVEFAGDYYTGSGNKRPSRKYYRVLDVTGSELVLEKISKPTKTTPSPESWREEHGYSNGEWPFRSRFRKKYQPYGVRICEETLDEIRGYDDCTVISTDKDAHGGLLVQIETREGALEAREGAWIMEDSKGHHYPIADEELRQTYEPIED